MAKGAGHGKIRGFFFEIDGDTETLQEGLRNFGTALGRALAPPARAPRLALPTSSNGDHSDEPVDAEVVDEAPEDDEAHRNKYRRKAPTSRRSAAMPQVLQVDLDGKDGTSFRSFAERKTPDSHVEKFLVITAWFKNHGGVDEVTADHAFTCFKVMGWTPHPKNYTGVFVDVRRKRHALDEGSKPGAYKLNLVGQNLVDKMGTGE